MHELYITENSSDIFSESQFDPIWCKELRPDCGMEFTKQNCKEYCKLRYGKNLYILESLGLSIEIGIIDIFACNIH